MDKAVDAYGAYIIYYSPQSEDDVAIWKERWYVDDGRVNYGGYPSLEKAVVRAKQLARVL